MPSPRAAGEAEAVEAGMPPSSRSAARLTDRLFAASYASTPSAYDVPHERPDTVYDLAAVVPTRTPPL